MSASFTWFDLDFFFAKIKIKHSPTKDKLQKEKQQNPNIENTTIMAILDLLLYFSSVIYTLSVSSEEMTVATSSW